MENCAFIDIFTTHNDLYGHYNSPVQFCCEIYKNDEIFNENLFLNNPPRQKIINIIPNEPMMISGKINIGYNIPSETNGGVILKDALESIHKLLKSFNEKSIYIIGYNHIDYDIRVLNEHFEKVLNYEKIEFKKNHLIDVMKLAEKRIGVNFIGNYTMDSVYMFLNDDYESYKKLKENKSTATDILMTKRMFSKLLDLDVHDETSLKFSDVVKMINEPKESTYFNFGKYKGALIADIFTKDRQYISWLMRNADIRNKNPDLFNTLKNMFDNEANAVV